jgi:hypothetical protein
LQQLIRKEWDHQRYFPLPIATKLSQQFAQFGLQFFKVNKTVTHVSVARPQYLDLDTTPVSDGIRRIVEYINATPKCTRKKLVEALAPTPKRESKPPVASSVEPVTAVASAPTEGEAAAAPAPAPAKPAEPKADEPTPEQTLVMVDLHWLIHQGAVLEFADGRMETAKKPAPKPPKPEKKERKPAEGEATATPEAATPAETVSAETPPVEAEVAPEIESEAEALAPAAQTPAASESAPAAEAVPTPAPEAVSPAPEPPAPSEPAPAP